jgi:2'-5' RNA ligase
VALDLGEVVAARAAALGRELQRRAAASAPDARITWIPADRLHLTVRFIGEVDDGDVRAVCDALQPSVAVPPFDLSLAGVGTFPKGGSPRVLWIGIADGREPLLAVEREISARLTKLGIAEEDRPYSPHLTLARVREPAGLRSARLLQGVTAETIGTTRIDTITLFQSRLSPKGPTYTPLVRIPCAS